MQAAGPFGAQLPVGWSADTLLAWYPPLIPALVCGLATDTPLDRSLAIAGVLLASSAGACCLIVYCALRRYTLRLSTE